MRRVRRSEFSIDPRDQLTLRNLNQYGAGARQIVQEQFERGLLRFDQLPHPETLLKTSKVYLGAA